MRRQLSVSLRILAACSLAPLSANAQGAKPASFTAVETILGRSGAVTGDVIRFAFPRSDLSVQLGDVKISPGLALGGWLAFKEVSSGQAVAMGDLVLLEDEVGPVMAALQAGGVEQTAVHNHLLGETPHVLYMHVMAHGDPSKIAHTVHDALASSTKTPMAAPVPAPPPASVALDTAGIARALGVAGRLNGSVYQVTVPRSEKIMDMGIEVPPAMGTGTAINFQPTGGGKAAITGDFVLKASEVNPVLRALRDHGIQVTAVHSHMIDEEPRVLFMHFWANDDALKLAAGLKAALALTASKR